MRRLEAVLEMLFGITGGALLLCLMFAAVMTPILLAIWLVVRLLQGMGVL